MSQHLAHYKEAHPVPFVVTHYINLICMILLIFTGFQIHYPFWSDIMGVCRGVHVFCGIVVAVNLVVRVILAFCLRSAPALGTRITVKDYKNWLVQDDNKHQFFPMVRFYLGIKKDHPLTAKYNPLQKMAYWGAAVLIIFMLWTGLCLWEPTSSWPICQFLLGAWGGAMSMRIIHWFGMFVMIIFMMAHMYMCFLDGVPTLSIMFARKEHPGFVYDPEKHNIVGEDEPVK